MDITQIPTICLSAVGIAFVYFLLYFFVLRFARAELTREGAYRDKNAIRIYAKAQSLEYYLRLAIAASASDRVTIIVHIQKSDSEKDEMKAIVRMMRRKHKNIFYTMI